MTIIIKPIKISSTYYLLVPKTIGEIIEAKDNTKYTLSITKDRKSIIYTKKDQRKGNIREKRGRPKN